MPLRPRLGYSVNLQTELFTGKTADELGFYCDMAPVTAPKNGLAERLLTSLIWVEQVYIVRRGIQRIYMALGLHSHWANVPFRFWRFFEESGHSVFKRTFPHDSVLRAPTCKVISYDTVGASGETGDRLVLGEAEQTLAQPQHNLETLVITQFNLDAVGHWSGPNSAAFHNELARLGLVVDRLYQMAQRINPQIELYVLSDHGMADVHAFYGPDVEQEMGPASSESYIYYLDGTIGRFWAFTDRHRERLHEVLARYKGIRVLSDAERKEDGLTDPSFGDIIAVVDEGYMLRGNFWGPKLSKGMHGYYPSYESQLGFFATNQPLANADAVTARGAFEQMFS